MTAPKFIPEPVDLNWCGCVTVCEAISDVELSDQIPPELIEQHEAERRAHSGASHREEGPMNAPTIGRGVSLAPANLSEAMRLAEVNVLLAIQWGAEVGLGPLQALQGIAVINGRPSIWGDATLGMETSPTRISRPRRRCRPRRRPRGWCWRRGAGPPSRGQRACRGPFDRREAMSAKAMVKVRERVLEVVAHIQAEGALAAPAEARALRDLHLPTLRRFAAGDVMSTDDLHRAVWGIETAAVAALDRELARKAGLAADFALVLCSEGHQEAIRRAVTDAVQSIGVRTGKGL